jgi:hypothetical protein
MPDDLTPTLDEWAEDLGADNITRLDPAETFDRYVLGVATRFNQTFLVYDRDAVISHFEGEGMTLDEAEEYFSFNVVGAWVGDGTPAFLTRWEPDGDASVRPPGHTCPAINGVQRVLRQIIWRMDNPDRQTRQDARDLLVEGLALLEAVRKENMQLRASYYTMKKTLKETE